MDESCTSSGRLCSRFDARTKRQLDEGSLDLTVPVDKGPSSAKRIHLLNASGRKPRQSNGHIETSHALNKTPETANRGIVDLNMESRSYLTFEMPKDSPQILNLSKNENGNHSFRNEISPIDDFKEREDDNASDLPMDLSKGSSASLATDMRNGGDDLQTVNCGGNGISYVPDGRTAEQLMVDLRNEETVLVLLKKIRQSQLFHRLIKDSVDTGRFLGVSPQAVSGPPPLVRSLKSISSAHQSSNCSTNETPRSLPSRVVPPATQMHSSPSLIVPSYSSGTSVPGTTTKSAYGDVRPSSASTISQTILKPQASAHTQHLPAASPVQPELPSGQSQAAAKIALRKQLEKTLLQIPPPKPPPPEMNFIPNVVNSDFVMLLGQEEAVKCILDNDARARGEPVTEVKYVFNPFQCIQCHTDFTPVWKRDKPGSKNVICEQCVTNNQKWALKQEHTNRLKSAFVKALQQEQEIEQSLIAPSVSQPHSAELSSSHSLPVLPKVMSSAHRSTLESTPHSSHHHHYQPLALPSPRQSTTLWTPPTLPIVMGLQQTFDPRQIFPFLRPQASSKSSVDLQRQYLLDLIPRRSHLDGPVLWRTQT